VLDAPASSAEAGEGGSGAISPPGTDTAGGFIEQDAAKSRAATATVERAKE
jgi:hypothetical protein